MKKSLIVLLAAFAVFGAACAPQPEPTPKIASATSTAGSELGDSDLQALTTDDNKDGAAEKEETTSSSSEAKAPEPAEEEQKASTASFDPKAPPKTGEEVAVLKTSMGEIVLKFADGKAPGHVKNFKDLANKKFYDGTKFHRIIEGFMIQGGDPNTKTGKGAPGTGGPGYTIKAEFNDIPHDPGILSMARSADPDSAGSQFFIVHKGAYSLDGQYTAFGAVVSGMDVVNKIATTPTNPGDSPKTPVVLESVRIVKWPIK